MSHLMRHLTMAEHKAFYPRLHLGIFLVQRLVIVDNS